MENINIQPTPNLNNIIQQTSLKWIFVGGKGGVGKTTVSSSLALHLAGIKEKVLIVSTDPAHSTSDAFDQKLGSQPTLIKGTTNLYGLEINPKEKTDEDINLEEILALDNETKDLLESIKSSIPGIDEALSIGVILQLIEKMNFSTIIFDTAPTGHTLRMLSFPTTIDIFINKLENSSQTPMAGLLNSPLIQNIGGIGSIIETLKMMKNEIIKVKNQFADRQKTTFIAVCIPEFLSMYETERLMQELEKLQFDCHNIIINQVLFPDSQCQCEMCCSRFAMQKKYINQIQEIYAEDFDDLTTQSLNQRQIKISILPFILKEVRGVKDLKEFGALLFK